jgi:hypothetical protein
MPVERDIRENIARVCHEANRAWCQSIGDNSQPAWEDAEDWQKESSLDGVKFLCDTPDAAFQTCHERWLYTKQRAGWRWGAKKDPENKLHPCIMPFGKLPPDQQMKDRIFHGIVRAMQ